MCCHRVIVHSFLAESSVSAPPFGRIVEEKRAKRGGGKRDNVRVIPRHHFVPWKILNLESIKISAVQVSVQSLFFQYSNSEF